MKLTLKEAYKRRDVISLAAELAHKKYGNSYNMDKLRGCAPEAFKALNITIIDEDLTKETL